ncbi:MAG: hypothetical protein KAV00_04455, partial [Phycisphaerae bacterium]|nr:hypothetical protein [Phycisphaerae bacterium]
MKNLYRHSLIGVFLAIVLVITVGCGTNSEPVIANAPSAVTADGSAGLLVIAHGAPMPAWNKPVLALEKQVIKAL